MRAVVLTGRILPGHVPEAVWASTARLFKLEPDAFKARVLARCPLTIKETADAAEAERIVAAVTAIGAQVEQSEADAAKWNLQQDGRVCGPVPLVYLKREYQTGRLGGDTKVKQAAEAEWDTLSVALGEPQFVLDVPPEIEESEEEPPPLPKRQSPRSTKPEAAPRVATPVEPSNSKPIKAFDSPDNWWMHWIALTIGVFLVMLGGAVLTNSSMWPGFVAAASATWVYYDATKYRIGKIPGRSGNNYSAGTWAVLVVLLWIVAFPYYLARRRTLIAAATEYPLIAQLRVPILVSGCLVAFILLIQAVLPFAGTSRLSSSTGPDSPHLTMPHESLPASTSAVPQKGTKEYDDAIAKIKAYKCQALQAKWNRSQLDLDSGNVFAARDLADISAAAEITGCEIQR